MFKLTDQVSIITGASKGIGKSIAEYFAGAGSHVVCVSRTESSLKDVQQKIIDKGGKASIYSCDVANHDSVKSLINDTIDNYKKIDILINNAAGNFISPTEMLTPGGFKAVVDIVLIGTFNCSLTVGKEMIKQKNGNILNIVTTYAWTGSGYVVPSASAKAGVLAMTRSLAVEWGKHNIRFNAIAPGPFPTKGAWSRLMPPGFEDFEDGMKDKIPMKRFGERHELENLASYLMSDGSAYINGEVVTIDGGEWLAGAAEFSQLSKIPDSMWKAMAERRKKK